MYFSVQCILSLISRSDGAVLVSSIVVCKLRERCSEESPHEGITDNSPTQDN